MAPTVLFKPGLPRGGPADSPPARVTNFGVEDWDGSAWVPSELTPGAVIEGFKLSTEGAARLGIPASDMEDGELEDVRWVLADHGKSLPPS